MGDDAIYALGKARAQFGLGNPQQAVATLDDLRERWPDYQSILWHFLKSLCGHYFRLIAAETPMTSREID